MYGQLRDGQRAETTPASPGPNAQKPVIIAWPTAARLPVQPNKSKDFCSR